jgi:hypothetical protein
VLTGKGKLVSAGKSGCAVKEGLLEGRKILKVGSNGVDIFLLELKYHLLTSTCPSSVSIPSSGGSRYGKNSFHRKINTTMVLCPWNSLVLLYARNSSPDEPVERPAKDPVTAPVGKQLPK